jgi:hypothetical protein
VKGCERLQPPDPALHCIADARHRLVRSLRSLILRIRAPGLGRLALVLACFLHS